MLREAITYLTTPCAPYLRSMGYLRELIATEARHRRCQEAWRPHLDNTKAVIVDSINATVRRRKAVVLGAGILSDIPIDQLSEAFERVHLIDVCFLRRTRRALKPFPNVTCHEADVTGTAHLIQDDPLPVPGIVTSLGLADADLVVSANVLAQLPLIPIDHARRQNRAVSADAIARFARDIVIRHLDLLATCAGTVCLITEVERRLLDETDALVETEDPLWGVPLAREGKDWLWDLAPRGEVARDLHIQNRVIGSFRCAEPTRERCS